MLTAEQVKARARALGADAVSIGSNYSSMGYGGLTYLYMPMVVINLAKLIEDDGWEAIPYGHQSDWRAIGQAGELRDGYSVAVEEGRAHPDVMVHLRIAAYLSGLGEIGYSKVFLTPQFGPRQRIGIVITEAKLEPDPIYDGPQLCNRCMACVRECPGKAIPEDKTVKVTLAGHEVEWADIDLDACDIAFRGGQPMGPDDPYEEYTELMYGTRVTHGSWSPFHKKPRNLYNTGQAVCGGRGCLRACMINLEARGVLENKFHEKFRRRKPWTVDWSGVNEQAVPGAIDPVTGQPTAPKPPRAGRSD